MLKRALHNSFGPDKTLKWPFLYISNFCGSSKELLLLLYSNIRLVCSKCELWHRFSCFIRAHSCHPHIVATTFRSVPVGVLFIIWKSVGSCEDTETEETTTNHCDTPTGVGDNLESNIVVHADCHSANKGLFGGIIVLVLCVVSIILFFIAISDEWVAF